MSTILSYVWIKKFGCLENVGFQLDSQVKITYHQEDAVLGFEELGTPLPFGFWDKEERIQGVYAIVGNNGKGKTTFLKAILETITQLYLPESITREEYIKETNLLDVILVVKNNQSYKILNMGTDISKIDTKGKKIELEMISDKLKIRELLKAVKVAFFSNVFDYRDYSWPKAEHISDYSFGRLLMEDFRRQARYERQDGYEDPVREYVFHNIYRQVSFMTEFYGKSLDYEEQKRMFQSWPLKLDMHFMERRGKEAQTICFYGVFAKILDNYVQREEINSAARSSHGFSPHIFAERRLKGILNPSISQITENANIIRYKLCRETFQNLLKVDDFFSFYKGPDDIKLGEKLKPIVEIICEAIQKFGNPKEEELHLTLEENLDFYQCLAEKLLELVQISDITVEEKVKQIAQYYGETFIAILNLPKDIFDTSRWEENGSFSFFIKQKKTEYIKIFQDFLICYKKIVLPYTFLGFSWGMSSGEDNLLSMYSRLFAMREVYEGTNYHQEGIVNYVRRFKGEKIDFNKVSCKSMWILMDEADLTYHPEWQKQLVADMVYFFPKIIPDNELKIQIIFTTHSPILLGDIPKQNVIYMRQDNNKILVEQNMNKNTFGQNIYVLFQDSFFIDGPMGAFAMNQLNSLLNDIMAIKDKIDILKDKEEIGQLAKEYLEYLAVKRKEAMIFGDKVIVHKVLDYIDVCEYKLENIIGIKEEGEKIEMLEREIKLLEIRKEYLEKQVEILKKKN